MTNGFALNHDKSLQIYFFCVKRQAKNDFLKDVESTVDERQKENNLSGVTTPSISVFALQQFYDIVHRFQ